MSPLLFVRLVLSVADKNVLYRVRTRTPLSRSDHFDAPLPAVRAREGGHITYSAPDTPYIVGEHVRAVTLKPDGPPCALT